MPSALLDTIQPRSKRTWFKDGDKHVEAVYKVNENDLASLPGEGESFPGETATALGPFIVSGGISYGWPAKNGFFAVRIRGVTLATRTGT